jgi:ketosteroid isomerase-like protein
MHAGRFVLHGRPRSGDRARARVDLIEVWVEDRGGSWKLVHHRDLRRPIA